MARKRITFGLDTEQLSGVIHHRFLRGNFGTFPARTAHGIQRRMPPAHADIFRHEIRLLDRNVKFALFRELQHENFRAFQW